MRARLEVTGEESTSPGPVRFDLAEERSPVPMEMAASHGTPGDVEASEVRPTSGERLVEEWKTRLFSSRLGSLASKTLNNDPVGDVLDPARRGFDSCGPGLKLGCI